MPELVPLSQPHPVDHTALFKYVRVMLGGATLDVEIDDAGLTTLLENSLETYSRLIPKIRWFTMPAFAGVQEYRVPRDQLGYGVVDVMIPRIDPIAPLMLSSGPRMDIFGYRYSYPYRDINELYIDYTYFKEATRILSSEFDWEFKNGAVYVTPKPDEPFTLTFASAFPRDLQSIPLDDVDWVRMHLLAQAEIALGRTRRKFRIPGAQTDQVLDGRELVQEGMARLQQAEANLLLRTPPLPIFRT
jgi:hypothetical protein